MPIPGEDFAVLDVGHAVDVQLEPGHRVDQAVLIVLLLA
jgi:hypothetical protein